MIFCKNKDCEDARSAAEAECWRSSTRYWGILPVVKGQNQCQAPLSPSHHQTPSAQGEQRETLRGGGPGTSLQGQCTLINNNLSHIAV